MSETFASANTDWYVDESKQWVAHALLQGENVYFGPFKSFAALIAWVDANLRIGVRCFELNAPDSDPTTWMPGSV